MKIKKSAQDRYWVPTKKCIPICVMIFVQFLHNNEQSISLMIKKKNVKILLHIRIVVHKL
jgi:hypothetical protein